MNAPVLSTRPDPAEPRYDWTLEEVEALFEIPFTDLVFRAAEVHRRGFDPTELQISQLLSVKTGGVPRTAATAPKVSTSRRVCPPAS